MRVRDRWRLARRQGERQGRVSCRASSRVRDGPPRRHHQPRRADRRQGRARPPPPPRMTLLLDLRQRVGPDDPQAQLRRRVRHVRLHRRRRETHQVSRIKPRPPERPVLRGRIQNLRRVPSRGLRQDRRYQTNRHQHQTAGLLVRPVVLLPRQRRDARAHSKR